MAIYYYVRWRWRFGSFGFRSRLVKPDMLTGTKAIHIGHKVHIRKGAWSKTKADLVGKLDNDCLPTPGWTGIFAQAHQDIPQLGAVGMWHFFEEDFDYDRASHKIQQYNGHQIFRHPWIAGSGFIMKRKTFLEQGPWKTGDRTGTTYYFMHMARAGYINGWYHPLIYQEHMDDPKSKYCVIKDTESFNAHKNITFGLKSGNYDDIEGRMKRRNDIVRNLLDDPFDVKYYFGWRKSIRTLRRKFTKIIA
ncbi:MAG: hypothetical protein GXY41_07530 [Phycisphaerae bacterium]|nr:hypothetical protein [Phycisphaerae bacterium]